MPLWLRRLLIIALLILPPALFLLLAGPLFLPDDPFWAFIAILGVIGGWIAALAGLAQVSGYSLRDLWTPAKQPPSPPTPDWVDPLAEAINRASAMSTTPAETPTQPHPPHEPLWPAGDTYSAQPDFTGRQVERKMLSDWLEGDTQHPLLVVCAVGGWGKSALAWHWLTTDVDRERWPRVVWWNFYKPESTFESFLRESLAYLGVNLQDYPGPRPQADALLAALRQPGVLLVLDGFERALRAGRGQAASARLRGQHAGMLGLAGVLRQRRSIQATRRVPAEAVESLLV